MHQDIPQEQPSQSIFCVCGATGEYSDRTDWIVCWLPTMAEAETYRAMCQTRANEISAWREVNGSYRDDEPRNEHDQQMRMSYTGTTYGVAEIPKAVWKQVSKH